MDKVALNTRVKTAVGNQAIDRQNIEDIYPLSPMQQGMLFHSLFAPESGIYVEQVSCTLQKRLELSMFEQAWQQVINRYPTLRTVYAWEDFDEPLQIVQRQVKIVVDYRDWKDLSLEQGAERLQRFLNENRRLGFDFSSAPLMRIALFQLAEASYQFVWSFHHSLLDRWSVQLILREVLAWYEALSRSETIRLETGPPYREYIAWLQKQDISRAEAFWREQLKGFKAPTPVGSAERRSIVEHKPAFGEQQILIPVQPLQALARQSQLTLNTIVQGAWAILLSHYSGEQDIVFGVVVSGRPIEIKDAESIIGLLVNTLPARVRVAPDAPLRSWLFELQSLQVELRQYAYSPLIKIQGWSEISHTHPLFESILGSESYPVDGPLVKQDQDLEIDDVNDLGRANYPLTAVALVAKDMVFTLGYDRRRFTDQEIGRMLGQIKALLENFCATPDQPLYRLPLITEAEREQVIEEWNQTLCPVEKSVCIQELFEAQVEQTPDSLAVVCQQGQLSYRQLNARVNQLAHYLRRRGIGPEKRVGVCFERSLDAIVAILGVLKAGGAYVPFDPIYPQNRLALMLEDAEIQVLITRTELLEIFPPHSASIVCLDSLQRTFCQESLENPAYVTTPKNLAYVIYTSGSTGRPKGVMVQHRSVVNFAMAHQLAIYKEYSGEHIRALVNAPFAFDASVERYLLLLYGHTLFMPEEHVRLDVDLLRNYILQNRLNVLDFTPSQLRAMIATGWLIQPPPELLAVLIGGEAIEKPLWQVLAGSGGIDFYNVYGPTECTVNATTCKILADVKNPTIGRPLTNVQVYILDGNYQPVPIGITGELYVAGEGVSRGYLNRPEFTAERFIANPFSRRAGARVYRTGDLVRYLPDGNIEFIGRADHQVKVRGYRIELAEIETALTRHPGVREVVVMAREDAGAGRRLVAYLVPDPKNPPTLAEIREFLKGQLPDYMVPTIFSILDEFPRSASGKVDRKSLPAPEQGGHKRNYIKTLSHSERQSNPP